jgi:hypothetical protein
VKGKYHKLTGVIVYVVVMLILLPKQVKNYHVSANPCGFHENYLVNIHRNYIQNLIPLGTNRYTQPVSVFKYDTLLVWVA